MTKPGHKEPLFDNSDPADLSPHAEEPQLRINQELPESAEPEPEVPPGLRLTDKEQVRVDRLKDSGLDEGTAALYAVSAAKAKRIIGHRHASGQVAKYEQGAKEREASKASTGPTNEELVELFRDTTRQQSDHPPDSPDKAA